MTPAQALDRLFRSTDWADFLHTATTVAASTSEPLLEGLRLHTLEEINDCFVDARY